MNGLQDSEFIIWTGVNHSNGTSDQLVPVSYPAFVDRHIVAALAAAARKGHVSRFLEL
jgi:uridine phosphorylase